MKTKEQTEKKYEDVVEYVYKKHNQERCVGFCDGYDKGIEKSEEYAKHKAIEFAEWVCGVWIYDEDVKVWHDIEFKARTTPALYKEFLQHIGAV